MKLEQCHVGKMVRMENWGTNTPSEKIIWCDWASVVLEHPNGSRHMYINHNEWLLDEPKQKYGLCANRKQNDQVWVLHSAFFTEQDVIERRKLYPEIEYHFPVKFDADGLCELPE